MSAKTVQTFGSHGQLAIVFAHSKKLQQFQKIWESIIPKEFQAHCKVANQRNQTLIIITRNATWSTKLRYITPDLIPKLQQTILLCHITKIECIVSPEQP